MSSASVAAAASSSSSSSEPANAVPSAAISWISTQLAASSSPGGGRAATDRAAYIPTRGLDALQVKDLRALCAALESLVDDALAGGSADDGGSGGAGGGAASLTARQLDAYRRFGRPRSGAKKALWMAAVRRCFYTNDGCTAVAPADDPIWALLRSSAARNTACSSTACSGGGGTRSSTASSRSTARPAAAAAPVPAPPRPVAASAAPHGMPELQYQLQQQLMGFGSFSPSYYGGAAASALSFAGSPFAAPAASASTMTTSHVNQKKAAPSRKRPAPPPSLPKPAPPDYVDFFVPESQWPPPNTNGGLAQLVKIKQEEHAAAASASSASASASAYASSRPSSTLSNNNIGNGDDGDDDDDDDCRPRDMREMSLLGQLRTMGFTDQREMLAGLRHVTKDGAGTGAGAGSYLDSGTILDLAMMWIISQREETEEAKKMDAVRIMAENEQVEEERRRKEAERRLEDAPIEDVVGAVGAAATEGGDEGAAAVADGAAQAATPSKHRAGRSKHFHFSILLHSPLVRSVFLSIACPEAKKELVRLLRLEQKANQWYGSVLPWAYFTHVVTCRIEKWANDESGGSSASDTEAKMGDNGEKAQDITSLIRNEANILERALFALSEQHDNGLQNVPKIFVEARDNCAKKGLPDGPEGHATGDKSFDNEDDDVVLVMGTFSCATKKSVGDDDLDRKPAALPSHSPRRNCASSEQKRPTKSCSEVIEIM